VELLLSVASASFCAAECMPAGMIPGTNKSLFFVVVGMFRFLGANLNLK